MKNVYLDNAATTPVDPQVVEAMLPFLTEHFGNPSSTHSHGRVIKAAIEKARKTVANLLQATPGEIFFTSGGTESDNTAIRCAIKTRGIQQAITSRLEHHAVLHTLEELARNGEVKLHFVDHDSQGNIDYHHLEQLLQSAPNALVSLMHGNNEIGNITDLHRVGELCKAHKAFFHSDTVQTLGHFPLSLKEIPVDSIVGAAHKFHGPKGVGLLYINKASKISPFITGGGQERNMRGGTENVYGIVGLARALEIAIAGMDKHREHILSLKKRMAEKINTLLPDATFNGSSGLLEQSLYTVLNVNLPPNEANDMLLFNLDLNHISVSGGSACSSGAGTGSHVIRALHPGQPNGTVRFSFSKYNTEEEIDYAAATLAAQFAVKHA